MSRSTSSELVLDHSRLAPVPTRQALRPPGALHAMPDTAEGGAARDSVETSRSVAQKLADLALAAKIEKRLFRVNELRAFDFQIESIDGVVVLSGKVFSEEERLRAVRAVERVPGVQSVTDEIRIQHSARATFEPNS